MGRRCPCRAKRGRVHHLSGRARSRRGGSLGQERRVRDRARIVVEDALDVLGHQDASAPISSARSAAAVSVVKNGLPVPAAKITIAALLQVPDRAAADVRLRDLGDGAPSAPACGAHARARPERQRVQQRREHPHESAGRPVHALGAAHAAEDVTAADDDRELQARGRWTPRSRRRSRHASRVEAILPLALRASPESFSRTRRKAGRPSSPASVAPGWWCSLGERKRRPEDLDPCLAEHLRPASRPRGSRVWSCEHDCAKKRLRRRPSTIFSRT